MRFVLLTVMASSAVLGTGSGALWGGINKWTSLGPEGGSVGVLTVDPSNPSTIYAAGVSGLYKSTDGGASWKPTSLSASGLNVLSISPKNGTLYAATWGSGLFKSSDAGLVWEA